MKTRRHDFKWEIAKSSSCLVFNYSEMDSMVEMGSKGHFPLFSKKWLDEYKKIHPKINSNKNTIKVCKEIIKRLGKHRDLEKKRTLLASLDKNQLMIFINEFIKIVEAKILSRKLDIH